MNQSNFSNSNSSDILKPQDEILAMISSEMDTVLDQAEGRDAEITALKEQLSLLQSQQSSTQKNNINSSESTNQIIALLKKQIDTLEQDKRNSLGADKVQNELIEQQQLDILSLKNELKSRDKQFKLLQAQFKNIMNKIQGKSGKI